MKKEMMYQLTEDEMLNIEGGKNAFTKASYTAAGVVLMLDSIVLGATCSPIIGVAAMGTAIACIEAAKDE